MVKLPLVIPKAYKVALQEHRAKLHKLVNRVSLPKLRQMYNGAHAEMVTKLRQQLRPHLKDKYMAHHHRLVLGQLKQGQVMLARKMSGQLADLSERAQRESVRGVIQHINKLEKHFKGAAVPLPVEQAARFNGIIDKRRTSLLSMHKTSVATYGTQLVDSMEKKLGTSLLTGASTDEAIQQIADVADLEWWKGERIVRTELAWAFNASQRDTIAESVEQLPDLMMRWVELVDDDSYEPFDDRVGVDSIAMHGQVAAPGDVFYMPSTAPHAALGDKTNNRQVSESLVGQSWEFPPNRPNDRSVLAPWRPGWGVPGWKYVGGRRRQVT